MTPAKAQSLLDLDGGLVPSLEVPPRGKLPPETATGSLRFRDQPAALMFEPGELERFVPIDGIEIPAGPSYVVEDVDTGHEFRNVAPNDALQAILARGRSPLTLEEGIALVAEHPDILRENHCFSLPGSRCGDKRVPAIWISKGAAKVGWCWAGNPHTWLGNASCARRVSL
ncbi:MAG TPA: DUF5701 family protein [Solirubrobacterales bacterium]|nr:DUF5701 family protein [Solirubrobacterales bacterium]